jgi:hypothetical protein
MNVVRIDSRSAVQAEALPESLVQSLAAPPAVRARELLREARAAAVEHLEALAAAIHAVHDLAEDVTLGGDAYSVGVRDLAHRLAEDLLGRVGSLEALTERERRGLLAH